MRFHDLPVCGFIRLISGLSILTNFLCPTFSPASDTLPAGTPVTWFLPVGSNGKSQEFGLPHPPYPAEACSQHLTGLVLLQITFDGAGNVKSGSIVRSTVPPILEQSTLNYAVHHWRAKPLAGKTVQVPVEYTLSEGPAYENADLVPPPDRLAPGDPGRKLKLSLTFGPDGRVKAAKVSQSSGSLTFDHEVLTWVKTHWHHQAYANQTLEAPFDYQPLPAKT